MDIILDDTLSVINRSPRKPDPLAFAEYFGQTKLPCGPDKVNTFTSTNLDSNAHAFQFGVVSSLATAYTSHQSIELGPQDFWYLILSEIALIIKANTAKCRPLFTNAESGKIEISIPTDDVTQIDLAAIVDRLRTLIPVDVDTFIPTLSTETPESKMAMYAALCDGVRGFYSYSTFMCGIRRIRVTGNYDDWSGLIARTMAIASMFLSVGLAKEVEYMIRIGDLLEKILGSFEHGNVEFWKGIFTAKNVGSGGQLDIDGWITELFFKKPSVMRLENFLAAYSVVPYTNLETKRQFRGVYGAFELLTTEDGYLKNGYASMIFEEVDKPANRAVYMPPTKIHLNS